MARCWGQTSQGQRCNNHSIKGRNFCTRHKNQTNSNWKKVPLFVKSHPKFSSLLAPAFVITIILTIILSWFDFIAPNLSLGLEKSKSVYNIKLIYKNESKVFSIRNVKMDSVSSGEDSIGVTYRCGYRTGDVINGVRLNEIDHIQPGDTSVKIYDNLLDKQGSWIGSDGNLLRVC